MDFKLLATELEKNKNSFSSLLRDVPADLIKWKSSPEKWSLLEIVCHLCDEEKEDFRARLNHVLNTPDKVLPSIDPVGWVEKRNYFEQDFDIKLNEFLTEREDSIQWLKSLKNPDLAQFYNHPKFGKMSGKLFLSNWLAHDYLHIRQITGVKFFYLKHISGETLDYAGNW